MSEFPIIPFQIQRAVLVRTLPASLRFSMWSECDRLEPLELGPCPVQFHPLAPGPCLPFAWPPIISSIIPQSPIPANPMAPASFLGLKIYYSLTISDRRLSACLLPACLPVFCLPSINDQSPVYRRLRPRPRFLLGASLWMNRLAVSGDWRMMLTDSDCLSLVVSALDQTGYQSSHA